MEYSESPTPDDVLYQFMREMNHWEKQCWTRYHLEISKGEYPDPMQIGGEKLAHIFSKFCTPKKRTLGRHSSFQKPPEYDPENERVFRSESTSGKCILFTEKHGDMPGKFRYVLIFRDGKWLIDNKQRIMSDMTTKPAVL